MDSVTRDFFRLFFLESRLGIWVGALKHPMPISLPKRQQYLCLSKQGYILRCNRTFAAHFGFGEPRMLIGCSLGQLFSSPSPPETDLLKQFVDSNCVLQGVLSDETDGDGRPICCDNSWVSIFERNKLVSLWGIRRLMGERERKELDCRKLLITLTANQRRILEMTVHGKTLKEIGASLSLSINTIESYRIRALRKLQMTSVPELIRRGASLGLDVESGREWGLNPASPNILP